VDLTDRFEALVRGPEDSLEDHLDEAALLIAAHANPSLDVDAYLRSLDELADACAADNVAALSHQLFVVGGFRGNDGDFADPRNSYLDAVLDRRLGIPITLSVVVLEVGRRLGVSLAGVSMPGHFLVRLRGAPPVLIDAFDGGRMLSETECEAWFRATHGPGAPWDPRYLDPVGPTTILARMLANLRSIHIQRQESVALEWVLRLRSLLPGATVEERAERAGVLAALTRFEQAATLLENLADEVADERAAPLRSRAKRLRAKLN